MDYEHHIFISYARGQQWTPWVRETFVPRLQGYLDSEIGDVDMFVDDQIQPGAHWEDVLRRKVARSKLMLPLLSARYFHRDWCRREMSLMLEREREQGLIGSGDNYGLLIPVRLGDGDCFPDLVGGVQYHDFEEYAVHDLPRDTEVAWKFSQHLKKLAKCIAKTLPEVPDCREDWQHFTGDEFFAQLGPKPLRKTLPRIIV